MTTTSNVSMIDFLHFQFCLSFSNKIDQLRFAARRLIGNGPEVQELLSRSADVPAPFLGTAAAGDSRAPGEILHRGSDAEGKAPRADPSIQRKPHGAD